MIYRDWITQIFAFVIVGSVYIGITRFGISVFELIRELTGNMYVSTLSLSAFFVLAAGVVVPLIMGTVNFESEFLKNGKGNLQDIFYYFSEISLLVRSYKTAIYATVKGIWYFIPAMALSFFVNNFYYSGIFGFVWSLFGKDVVYFVLSAMILAFFAMGTVLSSKIFVGIYICNERRERSISECFFTGSVCSVKSNGEMTLLTMSFIPLFVLSLFSMGFLFVMFTFPYMELSITMLSKYLYEKEAGISSIPENHGSDNEKNE